MSSIVNAEYVLRFFFWFHLHWSIWFWKKRWLPQRWSSRCAAILMTYISVFLLHAVTAALKIVGFFIFHLNSIKTQCCHMFDAKKKTFQIIRLEILKKNMNLVIVTPVGLWSLKRFIFRLGASQQREYHVVPQWPANNGTVSDSNLFSTFVNI